MIRNRFSVGEFVLEGLSPALVFFIFMCFFVYAVLYTLHLIKVHLNAAAKKMASDFTFGSEYGTTDHQ